MTNMSDVELQSNFRSANTDISYNKNSKVENKL